MLIMFACLHVATLEPPNRFA